ncbi:MAG: hypothetical protein H7A36_03630 [Chlamydiales bacterium]|nr:hypothetical protein [Chlamydiales bacterium]
MVKPLIISLPDLVAALRKNRYKFLGAAALCSVLLFYFALSLGYTYEAKATIKVESNKGGGGLGAKLLSLSGVSDDSFVSSDDPKLFLTSYKVAEKVADRLLYQGLLREIKKSHSSRLAFLAKTLATFKANKYYAAHTPPTLYGGANACPKISLFPDENEDLYLSALNYPGEGSSSLLITFRNAHSFSVTEEGMPLGSGVLGSPFSHDHFSFTLRSNTPSLDGRTFTLSLIPKSVAIHALQNRVKVEPEKKNPDLLVVEAKHGNRHAAARIVNLFIQEYHSYLRDQGAEKIEHQLLYLSEREANTAMRLRELAQQRAKVTKEALKENRFSIFGDAEIAQATLQDTCERHSELRLQIQELHDSLFGFHRDLDEIIPLVKIFEKEIAPSYEASITALDSDIAELKKIELDITSLKKLSTLLDQEDFQLYAFSEKMLRIFEDAGLEYLSRMAKGPNRTMKERAFAAQEIESEKAVAKERIAHLVRMRGQESAALKSEIEKVRKALICSFAQELKITERDIAMQLIRYGEQSEDAVAEHTNNLNQKVLSIFHGELLKMVEAKNLSFNLESLSSRPFEWATAPLLPKTKPLGLFSLVGVVLGLFIVFVWVVLHEVYLGPTASRTNLEAMGKRVIDDIPYEILKREARTVALCSKQSAFAHQTAKSLRAAGKKVLLFLMTPKGASCFEKLEIKDDALKLGNIQERAMLQGEPFKKMIQKLQDTYDIILFVNVETSWMREVCDLAELTIYGVVNERVEEMPEVDFYWHTLPLQKKKLSDIKLSSFSSSQPARSS